MIETLIVFSSVTCVGIVVISMFSAILDRNRALRAYNRLECEYLSRHTDYTKLKSGMNWNNGDH